MILTWKEKVANKEHFVGQGCPLWKYFWPKRISCRLNTSWGCQHTDYPSRSSTLNWNDIMMSFDQGKPVILVLLDLSAAFDTVGHNVLFSRLKDLFGLCRKVLESFNPIWNNASRECLFMVFYLTFSFYYLVYHRVQFLVLWFSQCIPVLLKSFRSYGLNITNMLMTHSCIYHWILTMS